jgi:small-conductance mechanosensitive channel
MMSWLSSLELDTIVSADRALLLAKALTIVLVGLLAARLLGRAVSRVTSRRLSAQESMLLRRIVFYSVLSFFTVTALQQLGINLSVLLGAAGILTVAIGFASQTSASNLISGLFLVAERTFAVGDYVRFEDIAGEVVSIDLLSVKLRTFDNLMVRIPNENIIKQRFTNLTAFPIRRIDLKIGVAYKESLDRVKQVLLDVAERNPLCLEDPAPRMIFVAFGDSALELELHAWATTENVFQLRTDLQMEIKAALDASGIEIPFPHRTLYAGSVTEPFPVRVVEPASGSGASTESGPEGA